MNWKVSVIVIFLLGSFWIWQQIPDDKLHVYFCDVGQGDGAVITYGYFQAIMDTGAYSDKILKCLSGAIPFWDKKIELAILSHSDKDHVGALPAIRSHYKITKIIEKAEVGDRFRYQSVYFDIVKGSENNVTVPMEGSSVSNESSIVVNLGYKSFNALFTGDIDQLNELALVDSGLLRKVDILKVAHHGSKYSSAMEFLEALKPKYAIVSVGAKNTYGHPNGDVLMRLDGVGAKVLRTDKLGTIEAISDGKRLEWKVSK